jgi:hypothetical protein
VLTESVSTLPQGVKARLGYWANGGIVDAGVDNAGEVEESGKQGGSE